MNRKELILHVFSLVDDKLLSPVQVQKLLFLVDDKVSKELNNAKYFNFTPYDFGPFDKEIYVELNSLISDGKIVIVNSGKTREYQLVETSRHPNISEEINIKLKKLITFVKNCSFKELLTAIYRAYPETATNAVYKEWGNR